MAERSKIETELLGAVKVPGKKKNESYQDYLTRLYRGTQECEQDVWDSLTTPVQDWANSCVAATNANKELPDFPDLETKDDDMASKKAPAKAGKKDDGAAAKAPAKNSGKGAAAKSSGKAPAAAKAAKSDNPPSMRRVLKQIVVRDPAIAVDELIEKLKGKGFKASDVTVSSIRSDTRDTMKVLADAGLLVQKTADRLKV